MNFYWIAAKELLAFFRDRRAWLANLLLPVLLLPLTMFGPLLLGGIFAGQGQSQLQTLAVSGVPEAALPYLQEAGLKILEVSDPQAELVSDRVQAALVYQDGRFLLYAQIASGFSPSAFAAGKVEQALDGYRDYLIEASLEQAGISSAILKPFELESIDVSSESAQAAGLIGFLIPIFLFLFALNGGQTVALEAIVGEKEKGSLEALLVAPVSRGSILLGKYLAVVAIALASELAGLLGIVLGGFLGNGLEVGGRIVLSPAGYLTLLVTGLIFALLAGAVQVALASWARSYREAQVYLAPLPLLVFLPGLLAQFSGFFSGSWLYFIPVANAVLLTNSVLQGSAETGQFLITWGSSLLLTGLVLGLAIALFHHEEVLYRN